MRATLRESAVSEAPLVSVITIFLNAERFLEEAIASVWAQSYQNWELLLVDDGATDTSPAIARRHADARPDRVRCLQHPGRANLGMSAARNLGLRAAQGDVVAFLDADDVWLESKLTAQVDALRRHPSAALVYGPTQLWYSWTGKREDLARDRPRLLGVPADTLRTPPEMIPLFLRGDAQAPSTCGALIRRDAALAVGGFEENFRGMYEDQAFFFKVFLRHPAFAMGAVLDRYRQHPDSASAAAMRDGSYHYRHPSEAQRLFLEWLERHLIATGAGNAAVRRALRDALRPYRHPLLRRLRGLANSAAARLGIRPR
jgi:glycosyltransferase involved in cell wall biosynthesis